MYTVEKLLDISNIIIRELKGKLPDQDLENFRSFCFYGVFDEAYEGLCTQIYEFEVKIPQKLFGVLKNMCIYYELNEHYWKNLEYLISN